MHPLAAHQIESLKFMSTRPRVFDISDAGTMKTRVELEDFGSRRQRGGGCALVLAPRSLLQSAWGDDCERFTPHLAYSCAYASNRELAFAKEADMYFTNTDAAKWLAKQPAKFFKKFDTLIIDESTAYKHHTSQRSKAIAKIKKYFEYRRNLTGTPNTNTVLDLWNQVNILDDGQRLGPSFYQFRNSVCVPTQVGRQAHMIQWKDREGIEGAVAELIKDITIRHQFENCIDIPPNFEYPIYFHLNQRHRSTYKEMEKTAIAQLQGGAVIEAINAAAVTTKLMQIASGAVYDANGDYHLIDEDRYELIADLVEQRKHNIVFFNWTHQRDELQKVFEARGLSHTLIDSSVSDTERSVAVKNYQAGFYRVLLAHPQSAAHGLTLTRGTATIWASPTYNLEHFLQGNKRIYRAGQQDKTETIVVLATGTIEQKVYARLQEKNLHQSDLLDLLMEAA